MVESLKLAGQSNQSQTQNGLGGGDTGKMCDIDGEDGDEWKVQGEWVLLALEFCPFLLHDYWRSSSAKLANITLEWLVFKTRLTALSPVLVDRFTQNDDLICF